MSSTPITIRRAELGDAHAIADIHVRSWQTTYRGILPDDVLDGLQPEQRYSRWERDIADPDTVMTVFVAEEPETGRIVGFCSVCPQQHLATGDDLLPPAGELHTMYVDVGAKGGGVGRALIERGEARMREMGFTRGVVWMVADNHPARAFYERMGWQRDGVDNLIRYGDREVSEIRLAKALV